MLGVILFIVLLAGASLSLNLARGWRVEAQEQRRKRQLVSRLHSVDVRLAQDSRAAKRAMNDAAGQSWRNRFE